MTEAFLSPGQLRDNYRRTVERLAAAAARAGRGASDVLLVAVTKHATPDQIRLLVELGHKDFAENRVQQLVQRAALLEEFLARRRRLGSQEPGPRRPGSPKPKTPEPAPDLPPVRWHMVGHLQRNKIKTVVPLVRLIHSVDTLRLAEDLHAFAARGERIVEILLQVNASGQAAKFGVAPPAAFHLAQQIDSMTHLRLRGLMTLAPYSDNPQDARPTFARTAELFQEIRSAGVARGQFNILSMGMTSDFEAAVAEGANLVRIGSALFGSPATSDQHEEHTRGEPGQEEKEMTKDEIRLTNQNPNSKHQ